ncbi:hypothetical protein [Methylobacterium oryzisoli]|uniref:hypothetical protein n=1 Tax=Methylobacterium oryzisoli TaxID=3385502 RepID=UPI0038911E0A
MKLERKTWAQIADMIVDKIQVLPEGEKLISLEFEDASNSEDLPRLLIVTEGVQEENQRVLGRAIATLVVDLSSMYDVRDYTLH